MGGAFHVGVGGFREGVGAGRGQGVLMFAYTHRKSIGVMYPTRYAVGQVFCSEKL